MTEAEDRAQRLIARLGIREPNEIDVELIAAHLGAMTVYRPLRRELGRLIRRGQKGLIVVDERLEYTPRARFVVAHELGHFLLHAGVDQFFLCDRTDLSEYRSSGVEAEANQFAAALLMPQNLFEPLCHASTPTLREVKALSDRFLTSRIAAARRLARFSPQPIAVVISSESRVQYVTPSASFPWVITRDALDDDSVAKQVFDREALVAPAPQHVPAKAWIDTRHTSASLLEHTMRLGQTGLVLTTLSASFDE